MNANRNQDAAENAAIAVSHVADATSHISWALTHNEFRSAFYSRLRQARAKLETAIDLIDEAINTEPKT